MKRTVEIITAGCAVCESTVEQVRRLACDSCAIEVLNVNEAGVA